MASLSPGRYVVRGFASITAAQSALLQRIGAAIELDGQRDVALTQAGERFAQFDAARNNLLSVLAETGGALEQRMVAAEETGKVQVQTGEASVTLISTIAAAHRFAVAAAA